MNVLYIYRSPKMGISIDNVFRPIEGEIKQKCNATDITFNNTNYSIINLIKNIISVKRFLQENETTIIHITGTEYYLLPFLKKYKTVATVHDLGFINIMKPGIKKRLKYLLFIKPLVLATKVTFISEKSFHEAESLLSLKNNNCCVIANPVNCGFSVNVDWKFNQEYPRILQVGTKINNKNLERTACALVGVPCHFRIIGPLAEERKTYLNELGLDYSNCCNLTGEQIIEEYKNCDMVTFASLYEGFGMPIIEGQACGKPVLTSNISPMIEVAAGSCVLVNPNDERDIRRGIIEVIENHKKYEELALVNVKRFSVDKISQEYFEVYKAISE